MPLFEVPFTDGSTHVVQAPDALAAAEHVKTLLTIATHTGANAELKGKAVAGAPKPLDKLKHRQG